ncbi:PhzF family phenazine biosynthesis protein [Asaia platycodi]
MTSDHAFWQVDVFAQEPFSGNPLAVITGADHLSDAMMRASPTGPI